MSSTTSASSIVPSGLVITGGIPSNADLAPSGIFLAIFILLVFPAIWRMIPRETRTVVLIRPCIFILVQIAGYITRILIAKSSNPSEGLYIAEISLVSIGIVFLAEPLSALVQKSVSLHASHNPLLVKLMRILRIALIASLVMSIYAATEITDSSEVSTVKTLRKISSALILLCIGISFGTALFLRFAYGFSGRATVFLMWISAVIFVASLYKLIQSFSHSSSAAINSRAVFYIFLCLPGAIGVFSFFIVDLVDIFDLHASPPDPEAEKIDVNYNNIQYANYSYNEYNNEHPRRGSSTRSNNTIYTLSPHPSGSGYRIVYSA